VVVKYIPRGGKSAKCPSEPSARIPAYQARITDVSLDKSRLKTSRSVHRRRGVSTSRFEKRERGRQRGGGETLVLPIMRLRRVWTRYGAFTRSRVNNNRGNSRATCFGERVGDSVRRIREAILAHAELFISSGVLIVYINKQSRDLVTRISHLHVAW